MDVRLDHDAAQNGLLQAVAAAVEAGRAVLDVYESEDFDVSLKSDDSPLTRADRLSHDIIISHLNPGEATTSRPQPQPKPQPEPKPKPQPHPHPQPETASPRLAPSTIHHPPKATAPFPVLSEEGATVPIDTRRHWQTLWIVDPLDGTKEFIKRNGEFTVNIALVHDQQPVLGVVYAPVLDRLYFGLEGLGAFRLDDAHVQLNQLNRQLAAASLVARSNSLPLKNTIHHSRSTISRKAQLRVVASRSHLNEDTAAFIEQLKQEFGEVELLQAGSSLKLCLVAEGSADIYPRLAPTMEWDTAAADAVVRAAGGRVIEHVTGKPLRYNRENLLNPSFVVLGSALSDRV